MDGPSHGDGATDKNSWHLNIGILFRSISVQGYFGIADGHRHKSIDRQRRRTESDMSHCSVGLSHICISYMRKSLIVA